MVACRTWSCTKIIYTLEHYDQEHGSAVGGNDESFSY